MERGEEIGGWVELCGGSGGENSGSPYGNVC